MIGLQLNGEEKQVAAASVADLLDELGLPPSLHLVEHNGSALLRGEWAEIRLREGDRIEILRVSAGG